MLLLFQKNLDKRKYGADTKNIKPPQKKNKKLKIFLGDAIIIFNWKVKNFST